MTMRITIVKAASAIEVQRAKICAGPVTPARLYASHRQENGFLLLCVYPEHQAEGRKHTAELFSLSRSNNVKCSPSLESCICKLVGMKQQLWLMLTCHLLSRQNSAVVNNGCCHYTP